MKSLLTTMLTILFAISGIQAQSSGYILSGKSTMTIAGTSTIHDWESDVQEINSDINFDLAALEGDTKENPVKHLELTIPVEKIESGKGGMNRKMHDALKKDENPNIIFKLTSAELTNYDSTKSTLQLKTTGMLNIAGVTREISLPVNGTIQGDGSYKFTGSREINMKDYNIDPPSAVFGTIKSGEMVTVSFEFYVSKELN